MMSSEGAPRASEMFVSSATSSHDTGGVAVRVLVDEAQPAAHRRGRHRAVALVATLSGGGGDDDGGSSSEGGSGPAAPAGAVRVSFAYSPEKEKLLEPLIRRFNSEREQVNGKPVFVEGEIVSSGEAESKLASGDLELTAWSPASSLWGRLLNFEADQRSWPTTTRRSSAPRS